MIGKKITLAGKERELRFTLNVMETVEELTGKNALTQNIFDDLSAKNIRAILYAYLQDDEELTIKDVGAMVDPGNLEEVIKVMMEAYNDSVPKSDGNKKKGKVSQ